MSEKLIARVASIGLKKILALDGGGGSSTDKYGDSGQVGSRPMCVPTLT